MSKHTPEPWRIGDAGNAIFGPPQGIPPLRVAGGTNDSKPTRHDIRRIVSCVNAMAGKPDPAAYVAAVRELREAAQTVKKRLAETSGGGRTLHSRESMRKLLRAALARFEE